MPQKPVPALPLRDVASFFAPPPISSKDLPPLDPMPLSQTNPWLAKVVDFMGGLSGLKDALVPESSGATLAGASLSALLPLAMMGGLRKVADPIKAYHGSPHDFEKFSLSKIGTGEGAQAYGHGLYFAENPQVAADYRKTLSAPSAENPAFRLKGEPVAPGTPYYRMANWLETPKSGESVSDMLTRRIGDLEKQAEFAAKVYGEDSAAMYRSAVQELKRIDPKDLTFHQPGRTYEVALHASPDEFLDWDKPLTTQPKVIKALELHSQNDPWFEDFLKMDLADDPSLTGDALYDKLKYRSADDQAKATEFLRDAGIKGIRYADAGSRGKEAGTSNYVVFDDALIEIMKKYGVGITTAAGIKAQQDAQKPKGR